MAWSEQNFTLTDAGSGTEHAITLSTPFRYPELGAAPLILCLDGAWTAGTVRDATRIMSMSGEAPEAIVVGVSFTDDTMSSYLRSRTRWFCPTPWVPPEATGVKDLEAHEAGHALTYLAFLRDQLLPRIDAEYQITERWLVGHSFSGLFGLRTMFHQPETFDKYLLASPSIWWHDRVMLDIEADYAAIHDDLAARVFMSAGSDEDQIEGGFNMVGNMEDMAARLEGRGYPSLGLTHALLGSETHSSTIGAAISRGLRALQS